MVAFSKTEAHGGRWQAPAVTNPDGTVPSIKRRMGTDYRVTIGGKEYTPQQTRLDLGSSGSSEAIEAKVTKVALPSPPFHRRPKAGDERWEPSRFGPQIINEPTASKQPVPHKKSDQTILVFDLGAALLTYRSQKLARAFSKSRLPAATTAWEERPTGG